MAIPIEVLITAGSLIGAGGCAWGGAKVALNGTRQRVKEISEKLDQHVQADHTVQVDMVGRLASIETKLDLMMERK